MDNVFALIEKLSRQHSLTVEEYEQLIEQRTEEAAAKLAELALAEKEKIRYQVKRGCTGGNDAGAFQRQAAGKKTCVLSVPCRYIHGPSSVMKLSDMEDQFLLAQAFARQA